MKLLIFLLLTVSAFSQDSSEGNECDSPLIERSKNKGLRSIKYSEYPSFLMEMWACFRSDDRKSTFKQINESTYRADQENSKKLEGFTSTCAYCASTAVIIFYIFKLTGN